MGYDVEDIKDEALKQNIGKSIEKINDGLNRIENIVSSIKEISRSSVEKFEESNIYSSLITACTLAYNKIKHTSNIYINGEKFTLDKDKNEFKFMARVQLQRIKQVWIIIINNAMDELVKIKEFDERHLNISIKDMGECIEVIFKDNAGGVNTELCPIYLSRLKGQKILRGWG